MKKQKPVTPKVVHTCNSEDRAERQYDADCLACQKIVARWPKETK